MTEAWEFTSRVERQMPLVVGIHMLGSTVLVLTPKVIWVGPGSSIENAAGPALIGATFNVSLDCDPNNIIQTNKQTKSIEL